MARGRLTTTDVGWTISTLRRIDTWTPNKSAGFTLMKQKQFISNSIDRIGINYQPTLRGLTSKADLTIRAVNDLRQMKGDIQGIPFDFNADLISG